jgi:hypothetical protein
MWTELGVFDAIKKAGESLGAPYHRANASPSGDKMSVSLSDESGALLGRYLVTKAGKATKA